MNVYEDGNRTNMQHMQLVIQSSRKCNHIKWVNRTFKLTERAKIRIIGKSVPTTLSLKMSTWQSSY